jgi:1,4-alpha-glucan branching enzyme
MIERVDQEDGTVGVCFRLPTFMFSAITACVVGEFNDWTPGATPMLSDDEGFFVQVDLQSGRTYRFRYLLDDARWENDPAADRYEPNDFGSEDGIVDLS